MGTIDLPGVTGHAASKPGKHQGDQALRPRRAVRGLHPAASEQSLLREPGPENPLPREHRVLTALRRSQLPSGSPKGTRWPAGAEVRDAWSNYRGLRRESRGNMEEAGEVWPLMRTG